MADKQTTVSFYSHEKQLFLDLVDRGLYTGNFSRFVREAFNEKLNKFTEVTK